MIPAYYYGAAFRLMPHPPDLLALLTATAQGDEAAFRALYDHTKSRVYNTALGYVQNREDAEEITQDVFVEVFQSAAAFRGDASVTTWLYRLTANRALDRLRQQKRQKRFAFLTSLFDRDATPVHEPADFVHPGVLLEQQENAAVLFRAIATLPDKQKTAYILTRVEGLSNIDVAAVLAVSVGAVESLLTRANENLKKQLARWYRA